MKISWPSKIRLRSLKAVILVLVPTGCVAAPFLFAAVVHRVRSVEVITDR